MVKIFIDPGHGGIDPGAVSNGLEGKNLTLSIALELRDFLLSNYKDVEVLLSRTADTTLSLEERTNKANNWGADFFLSIHVNAGGGTGFESYVYPEVGSRTTDLQTLIHNEVLQQVDFQNRGRKSADFHVLRETTMPALLTENGFIDNSKDAAKLASLAFRKQLALGHAYGIEKAYNLKFKKQEYLYKVQIGAFLNKENAVKLAETAKSKGFNTFVFYEDNYYRVQIGAFKSKNNADLLANEAKQKGFDIYIYKENNQPI